jgi:D-alanyl-D-alanine carboxypeptidase
MTKVKFILFVFLSTWMLCATEVSYGRYAAIMIDADNGKVLHEVEATHSWYPASLTKVMTLYLTFEALKEGRINFFDVLRTSSHAASQPTSKLGLRPGEFLTVRDAIFAVITRSANDAAVVLAEHLGGSEQQFAVKMTSKARSLGMSNTRFMNATGLPNNWQVTTSRDLALLAWKIQRHFPEYYQHFSAHSFTYKGNELHATNKFVATYPGAEGMKTGFTCGSGYNLIASASQNGKRLIGVVMGGMTSSERYQLMYQMMDAGFDNRYMNETNTHISTMPTRYTGMPPYQLSCGNRPSAFHATSVDYKYASFQSSHKVKPSNRPLRFGKKPGLSKSKPTIRKYALKFSKHSKGAKISVAKRKNTKPTSHVIAKKTNAKNNGKSASKKTVSHPAAKAKKTTIQVKKSNKTRYHRINSKR